jgi:hypothetical protein
LRKELAEMLVATIQNDNSLKDKVVEMVNKGIGEKVRRRMYLLEFKNNLSSNSSPISLYSDFFYFCNSTVCTFDAVF